MTQAYIQAAVRLIIVMGCAGVVLFALEMSRPPEKNHRLCDVMTMNCYDQLGLRLKMFEQ